jgi:cellulose biosynthesis protein BcsQ
MVVVMVAQAVSAVDLEGTASLMVGYAISRADLVIVPTQGSLLDATEAVKAIRLVRNMEKTAGKTIPTAVLFTRTSAAIRPRSLQAIETEFANSGIKAFDTQMHERDAFRAIFSFGGSLSDLDRTSRQHPRRHQRGPRRLRLRVEARPRTERGVRRARAQDRRGILLPES